MTEEEKKIPDIVIQEQYEDEGVFEQAGDDLSSIKHGQMKDKDTFIDTKSDKIIDKKDLSPFEQITIAAEQSGTTIRKPNSGCKHCYGRGYVGAYIKGSEPVACQCIFPPRTGQQIRQQQAQFNYVQAIMKKNKQMQKSIVNKTSKILEKEFNKRLQKNPIPISATEEDKNVTSAG